MFAGAVVWACLLASESRAKFCASFEYFPNSIDNNTVDVRFPFACKYEVYSFTFLNLDGYLSFLKSI